VDVAEETVTERERHGPYRSLGDLVRRAPPKLTRDAIENLVWVGGCDRFGLTRRELLWQVGLWLPPKTERPGRTRVRRQLELPLTHPYEHLHFRDVASDERLVAEYQVLGFAASGHPFSLLRGMLPPGVVRSDHLDALEHGAAIQVAGLVVARQRPETARGYTFVLMEDEAGMMNAIVRPQIYERDRTAIRGEPFLWIVGTLARDDGTVNVIAEEVRALKVGASRSLVGTGSGEPTASPYRFLKDLRQNAPGSKNWG
jgi:error-prone DNA polymerase